MTRVLVVDDNNEKRRDVIERLAVMTPRDFEVDEATTVGEAQQLLSTNTYVAAIVDMNLPILDDGAPEREGGLVVLRHINERTSRRPLLVVGLTEFQEIQTELESRFTSQLKFLLLYEPNSAQWAKRLSEALALAIDAERRAAAESAFKTDVCLITALPREFTPWRKLLEWQRLNDQHDPREYYTATMGVGDVDLSVVATVIGDMGNTSSAAVSAKVCEMFRPRVLAMTGIAAGVASDIGLGDVMIAERTWDYARGKLVDGGLSGSGLLKETKQLPASHEVRALISRLKIDLANFEGAVTALASSIVETDVTQVSARFGPFASSPWVLENSDIVTDLRRTDRKVLAVDMESHGLFVAADGARRPPPIALCVKSVSDGAIPGKSDDPQPLAAATSAAATFIALKALFED